MERFLSSPLIGFLFVVLAAGCDSAPPPVDFHTMFGVVRGNTMSETQKVADALESFHPRIRALVPGTRDRQLEIWAQRRLGFASKDVPGYVNESTGRIYVRSGSACLRQTIAHEMVHALLDETWDVLPTLVEEGLCEYVAIRMVQGCALDERTRLLLGAATYLGEPRGDLAATLVVEYRDPKGALRRQEIRVGFESRARDSLPPQRALAERSSSLGLTGRSRIDPYHYGFGLWLVDRIVSRRGLGALRELCVRAREDGLDIVPAAWLLSLADVGRRRDWQREVLDELSDEAVAKTVADSPEDILGRVSTWLRDVAGKERSAAEIMDHVGISFRFADHARIDLLEVVEFRRSLSSRL